MFDASSMYLLDPSTFFLLLIASERHFSKAALTPSQVAGCSQKEASVHYLRQSPRKGINQPLPQVPRRRGRLLQAQTQSRMKTSPLTARATQASLASLIRDIRDARWRRGTADYAYYDRLRKSMNFHFKRLKQHDLNSTNR